MAFDDELKFESELINLLFEKGWEPQHEIILYNPLNIYKKVRKPEST